MLSSLTAETDIEIDAETHVVPRVLSAFDDKDFSPPYQLLSGTHLSSNSAVVFGPHQKVSLRISDALREKRISLILKKMKPLLLVHDECRLGNSYAKKVLIDRIDFGLSGVVGMNRRWSAIIQKSEFHLITNELSLNDINRYQFHRNRPNGDDLPVFLPQNQKIDR